MQQFVSGTILDPTWRGLNQQLQAEGATRQAKDRPRRKTQGVGVGGYLGVLGGKEQVAAPAEAYAWRVWYENLHRLGLQFVVMPICPLS